MLYKLTLFSFFVSSMQFHEASERRGTHREAGTSGGSCTRYVPCTAEGVVRRRVTGGGGEEGAAEEDAVVVAVRASVFEALLFAAWSESTISTLLEPRGIMRTREDEISCKGE